jgi:purine-nucleoside phosphorylase
MSASELTDPIAAAAEAAGILNSRAGVDRHDIALVLGSGWGGAADLLGETVSEIPAEEVPGFRAPSVPGHGGTLRTIRLENGAHVLVLGARRHFYEGRDAIATAHGVRTAAAAGCSTLVLTNGCGGLRREYGAGSVVLISDHINLTGATPLQGPTFVDLTDLYSSRLRDLAREIDPELPEGVYAQFTGPQYETPAEVQMAKVLGADLVGMSTALEAIAARHAGMEIMGMSLVTNLAAGIQETPLSHAEVIEAGQAAAPRISGLLAEITRRIAAERSSGTHNGDGQNGTED